MQYELLATKTNNDLLLALLTDPVLFPVLTFSHVSLKKPRLSPLSSLDNHA